MSCEPLQKRSIGPRGRLSPNELWRKAEAAAKRRALEDRLAQQIHAHGLPAPEREFRFHEVRGWRLDFAWPDLRIGVEVDGGTGPGRRGRHVQPQGFQNDVDKMNAATASGWRIFRYTASDVISGRGVAQLRVELERAAWGRLP